MNAATESCTTEAELANEGVVQPTSDSAQRPMCFARAFKPLMDLVSGCLVRSVDWNLRCVFVHEKTNASSNLIAVFFSTFQPI